MNVEGTLALARRLAERDALVVFPSTNLVFDGARPFPPADAPLNPQTEYGRQKAEVEHALRELPRHAIVRFTKVLGPGAALLSGWADALRRGVAVHPFADMQMAPVPLAFAVEALLRVGAAAVEGVVQVSAAGDISYAAAARHVARSVQADEQLVQPILAAKSGLQLEHLPAHTTLDATRLAQTLGLAPPDARVAIERALGF